MKEESSISRCSVLRLAMLVLGGAFLCGQSKAAGSDPEALLFSFGLIADPQYADVETKGSRHFRASLRKLKVSIAHLNEEDFEFVVTVGDLIGRDIASFASVLDL